jgi:hypothetical protein
VGSDAANDLTTRTARLVKWVSDAAPAEIGNFCFVEVETEPNIISSIIIGSPSVIAPVCFTTDHDYGILADRAIDEQRV